MNTTGYSSPLAVCRVIRVTDWLPASTWSASVTRAIDSRKPGRVGSASWPSRSSYSSAADWSSRTFSTRPWPSIEVSASSSRISPDRVQASWTSTLGERPSSTPAASSSSTATKSPTARTWRAPRPGTSPARRSASPNGIPSSVAKRSMARSEVSPMPRRGTFRTRRRLTVSSGLTVALR